MMLKFIESNIYLAGLLTNYRKRKIVQRYLTRLRPILGRRFGKNDYYTADQVCQAAQEAELPLDEVRYGLAIYCTQEDFEAYYSASEEKYRYWKIRSEIAERHFGGNTGFTPEDVVNHLATHSESGAEFGSSHHGGGGHHGHHEGH